MTQDAQAAELDGLGEGFEVEVEGGVLRGWLAGSGPPVLLLHGGPGLSTGYLAPVVAELSDGYQVATYQQRGLAPSTAQAPYDVGTQADDVAAVLDHLGWDRAVVVGHSWGGHLLLHVLADHPDRVAAAVVIDPLGGVGDGGGEQFVAELIRRLPPDVADRVNELEARFDAGAGTLADADEQLRLLWPSYFNEPALAPVMPHVPQSIETNQATFESLQAELPGLAARLSGLPVPTLFVHGAGSPMPVTASTDTADAIGPAARVRVVEGAGHFVWHESPGVVRAAVDELSG
jgi:pimeloyl-ACP methyl ester carboxylesterase